VKEEPLTEYLVPSTMVYPLATGSEKLIVAEEAEVLLVTD
jgi:hypothetical protein